MRVIAYGIPRDYTDEYIFIGKDTTIEFIGMFAQVIIRVFGLVYCRAPNKKDTQRLVKINEKKG
jgi:hypothetical protein